MTIDVQDLPVPSDADLQAGVERFESDERRQRLYHIAERLVNGGFQTDSSSQITDGLYVLLAGWHARYYFGAGGFPSSLAIEQTVQRHYDSLSRFRNRSILSLGPDDESTLEELFKAFLSATAGPDGSTSSVGAAKVLHLLGPAFFPLWDKVIAEAVSEFRTVPYVRKNETKIDAKWRHYYGFCKERKAIVEEVESREGDVLATAEKDGKSTLKVLDEYNYVQYVLD